MSSAADILAGAKAASEKAKKFTESTTEQAKKDPTFSKAPYNLAREARKSPSFMDRAASTVRGAMDTYKNWSQANDKETKDIATGIAEREKQTRDTEKEMEKEGVKPPVK